MDSYIGSIETLGVQSHQQIKPTEKAHKTETVKMAVSTNRKNDPKDKQVKKVLIKTNPPCVKYKTINIIPPPKKSNLLTNLVDIQFDKAKIATVTNNNNRKSEVLGRKNDLLSLVDVNKNLINHKNGKILVEMYNPFNSLRYRKLQQIASDAISRHKVFVVNGTYNTIRNALLERGWVEKLAKDQIFKLISFPKISEIDFAGNGKNLEKALLSHLLQNARPDFIWHSAETYRKSPKNVDPAYNPMINRILLEKYFFTNKEGLCYSVRNAHWFHIENVAEVNIPRSYLSNDPEDVAEFEADYKLTACITLIKWYIAAHDKDAKTSPDGRIPLDIIFFALQRCKDYINRCHNNDVIEPIEDAPEDRWAAFFDISHKLFTKKEKIKQELADQHSLYTGYSLAILTEIDKYRPQLHCEGLGNVWVIKPSCSSRGRGIRLSSNRKEILGWIKQINTAGRKYIVQKYIESPLLIRETKFDIRQYFLVTSTHPLTIWMYKTCYLRFSSQKYTLNRFHESIHLTNHSIQSKFRNCKERHAELPKNNMWALETFETYLRKEGHPEVWHKKIYPDMKKNIIGLMLNSQHTIVPLKNRFELYGCDFILDDTFTPWLIEINSSPDMSYTTTVTGVICPAVLQDTIKVVIDFPRNISAYTGNFECVYRQKMIPAHGNIDVSKITLQGQAIPASYFSKKSNTSEEIEKPSTAKLVSKKPSKRSEGTNPVEREDSYVQCYLKIESNSKSTMTEEPLGPTFTNELVNSDTSCKKESLDAQTDTEDDHSTEKQNNLAGGKQFNSIIEFNATPFSLEEFENFVENELNREIDYNSYYTQFIGLPVTIPEIQSEQIFVSATEIK